MHSIVRCQLGSEPCLGNCELWRLTYDYIYLISFLVAIFDKKSRKNYGYEQGTKLSIWSKRWNKRRYPLNFLVLNRLIDLRIYDDSCPFEWNEKEGKKSCRGEHGRWPTFGTNELIFTETKIFETKVVPRGTPVSYTHLTLPTIYSV